MTTRVEQSRRPRLDPGSLLELAPYERIDNPVIRQEWRFLERGADEAGEFARAEVRYAPDARGKTEHVHPRQTETFQVVSGELVVTLDGVARTLGPGEEVTLPAGVPHVHQNAPGIETRVLWELRPPMVVEKFVRMLSAHATAGRTDAQGTPSLLAMAVFSDAYPDYVYLATLPVWLQKPLVKLLAPIGRARGYRADYDRVPTADAEPGRSTA